MKTDIPKKISKMMWDISELCKSTTVENLIAAARRNDVKITREDLEKLVFIVNSSCEQVSISSTRNFENQISEMVTKELESKSSKTK